MISSVCSTVARYGSRFHPFKLIWCFGFREQKTWVDVRAQSSRLANARSDWGHGAISHSLHPVVPFPPRFQARPVRLHTLTTVLSRRSDMVTTGRDPACPACLLNAAFAALKAENVVNHAASMAVIALLFQCIAVWTDALLMSQCHSTGNRPEITQKSGCLPSMLYPLTVIISCKFFLFLFG